MENRVAIRLSLFVCLWVISITTVLGDCPWPKKPPLNGHIEYQAPQHINWTKAPENYVLRYRCSVGYTLRGAKAILCLENKWTSTVPGCIRMHCNDPLDIENGHYELKTGVNDAPTIGSTAHYSCNAGYRLDNATDSVLTCHLFKDANVVQWKGRLARCLKLESCPDPGVSPDGTRDGDCCFIGDEVQYSCNEDFELEGEFDIQCLPGGVWSAPRPLCRPLSDHCDLPPAIPHGYITGEKDGDFYRPYDEVEVICEPGFKYKTLSELNMCEEENGWESEFEECIEAFCDAPEPLANGTIPEIKNGNMTLFPHSFELTYICDEGFRLVGGDSWRFCDTRRWSGLTPKCEVITCPDPGDPENGRKVGSSYGIGDKVSFKCSTGYELIGSFERYCLPNGKWSGELARCDISDNYCPDPGIPINGVKNSSNYDMGERVHFRCQAGFSLLGSATRECLPNRTWSGEEVRCIGPNDYDNPTIVSEILKVAVAEKREEQKRKLKQYYEASYSAWHNGTHYAPAARIIDINFPGRLIFYFAFDVSGSVREPNFRRSVDFAKAIVKKVGISESGARAGALTFSSKADTQFLPLDYNSTESVLGALDRLQYVGGGTSANSALALIREEQIPLTQAVLSKKGQKSIIFILTDGKANMGGDPQDEAELLKAAGVEIYCVGITNSVLQESLYKIASDPKDEHVFILPNYATLSHLIQEITKGEINYSECGLGLEKLGKQTNRGRIVGGRHAPEAWPWMAALYMTSHETELDLQCGGSIIHELFILTAAHCLYKKDGSVREPKELIVKLGLTDVKNETSMQEFEIELCIMHPLYRFGPIFDYDIALLKLKRPIEFNALVRPICLPPKVLPANTTLYKPNEFAVATGWGHSGVVKGRQVDIKSEDNLKEVILPIQTRERCMQSVRAHKLNANTFTENMFCVGDGQGGNDTCKGDSGGPLMQSLLNKEGYIYWTQVGIVSWGIGCGLPNTYGYYSHVQKLLDWLQDTIQFENGN